MQSSNKKTLIVKSKGQKDGQGQGTHEKFSMTRQMTKDTQGLNPLGRCRWLFPPVSNQGHGRQSQGMTGQGRTAAGGTPVSGPGRRSGNLRWAKSSRAWGVGCRTRAARAWVNCTLIGPINRLFLFFLFYCGDLHWHIIPVGMQKRGHGPKKFGNRWSNEICSG